MNPVRPEELSALLDGELDDARAREVEAQIAMDPSLRLEFEALSASDADWRVAAASAAFTPAALSLKAVAGGGGQWMRTLAATLGALVASRIVMKLTGTEAMVLGLSAISLALLIAMVVWLASTDQRHGAPQLRCRGSSPPARSSR
jgi:anti-sigma factor RsiW